MIFVTVGTQKFQFNRLLEYIDKEIENGNVKQDVFAQVGHSDYKPKNYQYKDFIDKQEFEEYLKKSDLVITHSGVGTIIAALNQNKPVIVVPRLAKYKEHVDDHQIEIADSFSKKSFVISNGEDIGNLLDNINKCKKYKFEKYVSSNKNIQDIITKFIEEI